MLTRRASSPLHGAADRSSSSITYIFISKDCFIRNADVLALHCAISAFKELPKTKFPKSGNSLSALPEMHSLLARTRPPSDKEVSIFTALTGHGQWLTANLLSNKGIAD